jgi:hypothetical protein
MTIADKLDGADWHFRSDQPLSFNCRNCPILSICGGLRVKGPAMDCMRFCCGKQTCNMVCFCKPQNYAMRLQEIRGFGLENIPRCDPVKFDRLKGYSPLIHHAYSRTGVFSGEMVSISLYELLDQHGAPKYRSRLDVTKQFRVRADAKLIVTGVNVDSLLERVWQSTHRESIALMLKAIQVDLVTSPNFSVYNNVPRPENLYNIKRNALLAQELLSLGVPMALHINACTDTDYLRYAEFLKERNEFQAISFEFITGTGYPSRIWWHVKKLVELSNFVGRPLQLVLRGGTNALSVLAAVYPNIVVVDSDPLFRALHRKRMVFGNDGHIQYLDNKLPEGHPVDDLLTQNFLAAKAEVEYALQHPRIAHLLRKHPRKKLSKTNYADYKSRQLSLLTDTAHGETGADAIDSERVIPASKA